MENIPLDCKRTWDLIGKGDTKGVFQLESRLGQTLAKKLKPENMEQLAALLSIMRPGSLNAFKEDGKSVTEHYINKKNGIEPLTCFHPALENALKKTYFEMCYQEQEMQIAVDIAGFNPVEADFLRKAFSKKRADLMSSLKEKFLAGCKTKGLVTEEEAEKIFEWIKASERYSFNKSITLDTTVETKDGFKALKDIQVGEYISSPNGYVKILNKYDHGKLIVYKVILSSGKKIKCTLQHKFLCLDGVERKLNDIGDIKIMVQDSAPEQIIQLEFVGIRPTIDIEVDHPSHIYYANGIATSNSHAVSYAYNSYLSAYAKAHFPRAFFTAYLTYAHEKIKPHEEIFFLIQNAKAHNIDVCGPNLCFKNVQFILKDKKIYFGLGDIKGVGQSVIQKLLARIDEIEQSKGISVCGMSWIQFLVYISPHINSTAIRALICAGALSYMGVTRARMVYEYNKYMELTKKEWAWCENNIFDTLEQMFAAMVVLPTGRKGAFANDKRKQVVVGMLEDLKTPPYTLEDDLVWIARVEQQLLGMPITCSEVDGKIHQANTTCKEFIDGVRTAETICIAVTLDRISHIVTKKGKTPGQKMAFVSISDNTGQIDSGVIFPDTYKECKTTLFENNSVMVVGSRGKEAKSLIISEIVQI
jgi:DNA polymerase III alpha subunit